MSAKNEAVIRRYVEEVMNRGNFAVIREVISPSFDNHEPIVPGIPSGAAAVEFIFRMTRTAFPDLHFNVDDMFSSGDRVVMRTTWTGTHRGDFMGVAPTGKKITARTIDIYRLVDGKISEHWDAWDGLGVMRQMGMLPELK